MKRAVNTLMLVTLLILPAMGWISTATAANPLGNPQQSETQGMPLRLLPARPIPHHESGQPARVAESTYQATRRSSEGAVETIELRGLDALLADGTMPDPLAGNYRLVDLDKFMFSTYAYSPNNFSIQSYRFVTPTLELISASGVDKGNVRFNDIAAGDLNGDLVDEQIIAWADSTNQNHIYMQIGELPGSFGRTTSMPGVVAHPDGRLDVLARGYDQALWHLHYDGAAWGSWSNAGGGLLLTSPATVSRVTGELDVFAVGMDNQVYHNHWSSPTWNGWAQVDGEGIFPGIDPGVGLPEIPALAAAARSGDQLDLFRRGPDHTLWWSHSSDGLSWDSWQNLGGMLASGPGAVSLGDGRMQVHTLGVDGALWYRTYDSGWGDWFHLEAPAGVAGNAVPVVISPASGQVDVYLVGTENRAWSIHHDGVSWGNWSSVVVPGDDLHAGVDAAVGPSGTYLFAQMGDGSLQYSLNASGWTSLDGLDVMQNVFDTGAATRALPGDDAVENPIFDIATGFFSGDGREQVILAYEDVSDNLSLEVYDVQNGFRLTKTAELSQTISSAGWPRVAAGDVDGDGVDELALVYVPDSPPSFQGIVLKVYQIDKDGNGQWTGGLTKIGEGEIEIDDGGDIWHGWPFGGTLRIEAGDIIPESDPHSYNDEFALVSDWRHDVSGNYRAVKVYIHLYDHDRSPGFANEDSEEIRATAGATWLADEATGVGLAVGDVNGHETGRGIDEVVVTWPRGFILPTHIPSDYYPHLLRDLIVYSYDQDNLNEEVKYEIPGKSEISFLDTLAVGDLDLDLENEIVMVSYEAWVSPVGYYLDVYEFDNLETGPVWRYPVSFGSAPRAFNLAMGDFTGDALRVGPPSYRRQHDVGQVIAIVNAPPKHEDVIDGVPYNLNADDADTYAQFEQVVGESTEVSVTTHKDWGVDSEFRVTIGDPDATHTTASIENSYGENFEYTGSSTQSLTYEQTIRAITDDVLYYTRLDYDVWEYPVFDGLTHAPQGYLSVVWPVGEMHGAVESGNACDGWYRPNHQLMNVWSYPGAESQLLDRVDGSGDLTPPTSYDVGVSGVDFSVAFTTVAEETRSHEYELGFAASFEKQIGGEEVGVNLGVVEFSTRLPSLFWSTRGEYNYSELSRWRTQTTESTTLSGYFEPIPDGGNYEYEVTPYLYWSENDYLVMDYVTDPSEQSFWSSAGANYDRPDPAFIRPWAEGNCDHLWPDAAYFTGDIALDPPVASPGEPVTVTATLRNFSKVGNFSPPFQQAFKVSFYQGDPDAGGSFIDEVTIPAGALGPRAVLTPSIQWVAQGRGEQHIYAVIDPDNALDEVHDENNKGYGVLNLAVIEFIDVGQSVESAYFATTFPLGAPLPISATLFVPLDDFTENLRFDFLTVAGYESLHALGSPIEIVPYQTDWEVPEPDFSFTPDLDDAPAAILVVYQGANLTGFNEDELTLYRYDWAGWQEANRTCGVDSGDMPLYEVHRFPEDDLLAVPVCKTGLFVLTDAAPDSEGFLFLPVVNKN